METNKVDTRSQVTTNINPSRTLSQGGSQSMRTASGSKRKVSRYRT